MPTQVQFRRGTTTQNNNFTGAAGELSVDTTLNVIRVHDGTTAGGHTMLSGSITATLTNKTINLGSNTLQGTIAQFNTALSDGDFATLAGTETLSNKTLTTPTIAQVNAPADFTVDAAGDIILDADGADVLLKDGGTTFGSLSQSGGELVIKSGATPTTAITMSGADVTISGNLTVNGATTSVTSNTVTLGDNTILLNADEAGTPSQDAGIEVERGTSTNASLIWNETADNWQAGLTGAEVPLVTTSGTQTLSNKTISVDNNTVSGIAASSFVLSDASGNIDGAASQKAIPTGTVVGTSDTQTLSSKTIALGSNTVSGSISEFNTALTDADFATLAGAETLTNKTITSPSVSGLYLSDASIVFEGATANEYETTLTVTDPTADRTLTLPNATDTLVGKATTDTLTNKTINVDASTGNVLQIQGNGISSYVGSGANVVLSSSPTITNLYIPATGMYFNGSTSGTTNVQASATAGSTTLTLPAATDTLVGKATTDTLINKSISLTTNTVTGTLAEFNTAVTDANLVSIDGVETLTNKTLTSPVVTGLTLNDASVVFEGATANDFETTLTVTDPTADRTLTLPDATDTLVGRATTDTFTNKSISLTTNTLSGTVAEFNTALSDDNFVTLTGTETLTNKTLTTPVISSISNTGTLTLPTTTDTLVGKATTDTFTNKSISLTTNTLTGTVAEFNTALSDDNFVTLTGTETLTNKTLTSPTMTTPTLGVASATSINKVAITAPATGSTLTIAEGKTLTANNTLTLTGTDSSSVAFGTGGTVAYTANKLSAFAATTSAELAGVISDETGSGSLVFSASPTFTGTVNAADLTLSGNLIVNGTTTTVNSNTVSIGDNIIVLNSDEAGTPSQNAGIEVERGTSTNASVTWDETNDLWMAGITGSEIPLVTTTGTQTLTNKTISGSNNTLSNIANASLTNSTISGKALGTNLDTLTLAVSGTGLSGSQTYNGSAAATFTVTSNATNANTGSTIVARDASGNFSAGTITATLSGNASTVTNGVYTTDTGTVTSTMIADGTIVNADINASAAIAVSKLAASTISGVTLGNNLNTLTIGTGLSGTSYNGSAAVTIANTGVTSNVAGTGVSVSGATGAVTISIGQAVATSSNVQFNSIGVNTAASGTSGEIRATNEITAYYSDARLKNFHGTIDNALHKVMALSGYYFTENEVAKSLGYTNDKQQVGVSAQEVEAVLPEAVAPAPIDEQYLTVKYEKLVPLLIEAIKEQQKKIEELEAKINKQ